MMNTEIFSTVFFKLLSGLFSIGVGVLAGKFSQIEREHIATLLFYFISPIVFFSIPAHIAISLSEIGIACISFLISCILCGITYFVGRRYFESPDLNILAMSAGTANGGYLLLPVAASIFDDYTLGMYTLALVGMNLYESSVGFFVCMHNPGELWSTFWKFIRVPNLQAFSLGCLVSMWGFQLPYFLDDFTYNMQSTYSVLGMMMVGFGISKLTKLEIDFRFTAAAFISKFILYPLVVSVFIILDKFFFKQYQVSHYQALLLLSTAPVAVNTIVFASIMNSNVEKVSTVVVLSALVSLVYIPTISSLYI